jgi:hypothetical protein
MFDIIPTDEEILALAVELDITIDPIVYLTAFPQD